MNEINAIGPIQQGDQTQKTAAKSLPINGQAAPSFKDTLNGFLNDVNEMQVKADQSIEKMVSGEITDVHQVMSAVEEANVSFNMMMEIRNKVMDAYQEIMRMRL
ncbi:MAG: flagellar hook-basal body complex protein FliE [Chitinivibrionales bacterium]|nr:flagellar hook-basal body complex protein FliE [Chitinivibrionales bacterium]